MHSSCTIQSTRCCFIGPRVREVIPPKTKESIASFANVNYLVPRSLTLSLDHFTAAATENIAQNRCSTDWSGEV